MKKLKYIWIIFLIISAQEIICKKIMNNKKEMIIYSTILLISIALCIAYYSDEYGKSLLGMVNDKINLEKMVWIK